MYWTLNTVDSSGGEHEMKCLNETQVAPMGRPNRSYTLAPLSWQLGRLRVQVFVLSLGSKLPYCRSCGPTWVAVFGTLGPNCFTSGVLDTWESACVGTGTCKYPPVRDLYSMFHIHAPTPPFSSSKLGVAQGLGPTTLNSQTFSP